MAMKEGRERVAPAKAVAFRSPIRPSQELALHRVQPKLAVSAPDDPYEHEADRVAAAVMRMPTPAVQHKCAACSAGGATCPSCEEEETRVQRKAANAPSTEHGAGEVGSDFASPLRGGAPLDAASRAFFEPRFGHSFGNVRVHTGPEAAAAARSIDARAFTLGRNVAFAAGEYEPQSERGRSLLAHELVHVVQQRSMGEALQRKPEEGCAGADRQAKWTQAVLRAREMNELAKMLLPDQQWRAQQKDIFGKYGLSGRAKGEKRTMAAEMGQRNAEAYVVAYTQAQELLVKEPVMSCETAPSCQDAPITYDGVFHVCPAWFDLPAETSGESSRAGSLLRAVYTHMVTQEHKKRAPGPLDAELIPTEAKLLTEVANELGKEMGTPGNDERYLTADELRIVMSSEEARREILTAAIDRLFVLVDLLRANDARLRPMSAETARALQLVRRYLRVVPTGLFSGANLEFDWLNEPANELFLNQTMRALELMIDARGLLLPKFHFKPPRCEDEPGLYAMTSQRVDLCPNFFGKGPSQAPVCPDWVLLHEYFHPLGVTHGEVSSSDTRMLMGPKQAIQNASALASLAFELAGRDLKKCRAPEASDIHQRADRQYIRQR